MLCRRRDAGLAAVADPAMQAKLACGLQAQAEILTDRAASTDWRGANWSLSAARRALADTDLAQYAGQCPE